LKNISSQISYTVSKTSSNNPETNEINVCYHSWYICFANLQTSFNKFHYQPTAQENHSHTYTGDYSTMFRLFLTAIIWEH